MSDQQQNQRKPQITLAGLSNEQLDGLKKQFEGDIESLTRALDSIAGAKNRFSSSKDILDTFKGFKSGEQMMVPLTSSLYIAGEVKDTQHVTIDVGTGYYIKHTIPRAQAFFDKRANQMKDVETNLLGNIHQKQQQLDQVMTVLQERFTAEKKAQ
jgi:prefoldin alpha subunit